MKSRGGGRGRAKSGTGVRTRTVRVELGERSYPIRIGTDTLSEVGPAIARATGAKRAALVTVPRVGRRYAATVLRSLRDAGIRGTRIEVPDGDSSKNLRQLGRLYDAFIEAGLDRSSVAIALGGGMVGDLTGFAAASFLRGISFVQIPTTILAMVDASIGGKVAVNLKQGKNLAGAFYQPRLVWLDTATLESLPRRDRAAGVAEIIKAGAIWDERFFRRLEREIDDVMDLEPRSLLPVLQRACGVKAEVVSQDEREGNVRMLLNFGHTMGHAVEKLSRYRGVLHGEGVAIGMVYGAQLSEQLGLAPAGTRARLEALVARAGLPVGLPEFPRKAYLAALAVDKKRTDACIQYVALRGIGRAETVALTPAQIYPAGSGRRGGR